MLEIREATHHDIPAMIGLMRELDADNLPSVAQAIAIMDELPPGHRFYVAVLDNEVAGMFALIVIRHLGHDGATSGIIEDVAVRNDKQGQGIGQAMMHVATERLKAAGCYKVMLSSNAKRIRAHEFYEQLGFQPHGTSFFLAL